MGRTLMYTALGALMLLVLLSFFVLEHGGEQLPKPGIGSADNSSPGAGGVSLHDLTTLPGLEDYRDHIVSTSGTLYFNSATNKHVIVDGDQNYAIVINSPSKLGEFEGKQVLVTGTFRLAPGAGPSIDATSVKRDVSQSPTPKGI